VELGKNGRQGNGAEAQVLVNGKQLSSSALVKTIGKEDSYMVVEAGSGNHEFAVSK
jgi:alpha-L-rhamnosidase